MRLLNTQGADTITRLLSTFSVRSSVFCLSELRAPWGFEVSGANVAKFHLVLEGTCVLRVDGAAAIPLAAGDLVILPHGEPHAMRDAPDSAVLGLDRLIADHPLDQQARLRCGGDGPVTRLLCGGFALGSEIPVSVSGELPSVIRFDAATEAATAWLEPVFALLAQEAVRPGPGAQAMFAKLADVFLAQALRSYLTGAEQSGRLLPGTRPDPRIDAAVTLIRDQTARQWTVQALAREVGMSRTLFTTRFRAAVGESPMRHLTTVRLGQAADYLATTKLSVEAIARRTGYSTSAALTKAFKREFEMSPGRYRETQGSAEVMLISVVENESARHALGILDDEETLA